jgi:hypothetical protein
MEPLDNLLGGYQALLDENTRLLARLGDLDREREKSAEDLAKLRASLVALDRCPLCGEDVTFCDGCNLDTCENEACSACCLCPAECSRCGSVACQCEYPSG